MVVASLLLLGCETAGGPNGMVGSGRWREKLPADAHRVEVDGLTYYHSGDKYFVKRGTRYVTVKPPVSTIREKRAIGYRSIYSELPERREFR
jgi:hypothetical protein